MCLLAFRGAGLREARCFGEPPSIRVGHVGVQFEDDPVIYGFHATLDSVAKIGGVEAALMHLKRGGLLDGALQDDTYIFSRARALSQQLRRVEVWVVEYELDEVEHARMHALAQLLCLTRKRFRYGFRQIVANAENCATFPRRLGIPLPYDGMEISCYVEAMQRIGHRW